MANSYSIDITRATLRENWWSTTLVTFPLALLLLKVFRVRVSCSCEHPNVESTLDSIVDLLPSGMADRFAPLAAQLLNLGFCDPVHHVIFEPGTQTRWCWTTFRHSSGQHCARIHHRSWLKSNKPERGLFVQFISPFADGTFIVSSSGKPDVEEPPSVAINRMPGSAIDKLWAAHEKLVYQASIHKSPGHIRNRAEVIGASECLHIAERDFHLARGFFRVPSPPDQQATAAAVTIMADAAAAGFQYPEVIAELVRLQNQKPKWSSALWVLVLSALAFVGTGAAGWNWKLAVWLVPVLLLHELGHWVAMRLFGYRNLRMFFIPFFGAAVTGRKWNVAGWKKSVVSLAGPLPGITFGILLGIVGMAAEIQPFKQAALMLIVINGFNLAPVLPLDGGHFLHAVLFCRNRWLDIGFRFIAVIALALISVAGMGRVFMFLAIALGIGLPIAFKLARISDRLRQEPLAPASDDSIPPATANAIITSLKAELPANVSNTIVAQHAIGIFETLNARPPGVFASLGLLALYGGATLAAIVCAVFLLISNQGSLGDFLAGASRQPRAKAKCTEVEAWRGNVAAITRHTPASIIVGTFARRAEAQAWYGSAKLKVPEAASMTLFGDSVLVAIPMADEMGRAELLNDLKQSSIAAYSLGTNNTAIMSLSFIAPTPAVATNIEQELSEFFGASTLVDLIPPWAPEAGTAKFEQYRRARKAYFEIKHELASVWSDAAIKGYTEKIAAANRRGDRNETQVLQEQRAEAVSQLEQGVRIQLTETYASTPYAELVTIERQLSGTAITNQQERTALLQRLAQYLGSEEHDDTPELPESWLL